MPFMSDEAVAAVPGLGKATYTLKQYMEFRKALCEKGQALGLGAEEVGRALWASTLAGKTGEGRPPGLCGFRVVEGCGLCCKPGCTCVRGDGS